MSRLPSSKTAKIWAERIAQCERSNAPVAQFCQSIGCSPMFSPSGVVQGDLCGDGLEVRRTARPQATAFLRVQTSDSTKDTIEIRLPEAGQRREAIGMREQPNSRKTLVRSSAGIE